MRNNINFHRNYNPFKAVLEKIKETPEVKTPMLPRIFPPFSYFGGKRRVTSVIWSRLGEDVRNYIEPFAGGLSVLLGRNTYGCRNFSQHRELVNDSNALLMNFWRAVTFGDVEQIIKYADYPAQELETIQRRVYILSQESSLQEKLSSSLESHDDKLAGLTLYVMRNWIGGNCLDSQTNVSSKMPPAHISGWQGITARRTVKILKARLEKVITFCNNWKICVKEDWLRPIKSDTQTVKIGITAVLLDPPYEDKEGVYKKDSMLMTLSTATEVAQWAIENGSDPMFRIACCAYEGQTSDKLFRKMPGWTYFKWSGRGYGEKPKKEIVWFSPYCLPESSNH